MTQTRVPPVLVTGATGRVGRAVVDLLVDAGVPVRALTHRSEAGATLPANVEVVTGDRGSLKCLLTHALKSPYVRTEVSFLHAQKPRYP